MSSRSIPPQSIEYATLLSYVSSRWWFKLPSSPSRKDLNTANQYALALKYNYNQPSQPHTSIYDYIARICAEHDLFYEFFSGEVTLVPIPGSCPHKPDSMWAPKLLADALEKHGLGHAVVAQLERVIPIPKSSLSKDRPPPTKHYDTMAVNTTITPTTNILLVDDVVTRGSTFFGSAWLLSAAYPDVKIRAFAAMRACYLNEFKRLLYPCKGTITLNRDLNPYKSTCMKIENYTQTGLFDV